MPPSYLQKQRRTNVPHTPCYVGLDLGTRTGWAVAQGASIIKSGVCDFSLKRNQHIGNRFIWFSNFMSDLSKNYGPITEIYYEKIMFGGPGGRISGDGHELYHGLLAVMNMHAAALGIFTIGVWPGTLKKSFTGSGVAEKKDMCAAAHALGWLGGAIGTAENHDECDALALLFTQLKERYNMLLGF